MFCIDFHEIWGNDSFWYNEPLRNCAFSLMFHFCLRWDVRVMLVLFLDDCQVVLQWKSFDDFQTMLEPWWCLKHLNFVWYLGVLQVHVSKTNSTARAGFCSGITLRLKGSFQNKDKSLVILVRTLYFGSFCVFWCRICVWLLYVVCKRQSLFNGPIHAAERMLCQPAPVCPFC